MSLTNGQAALLPNLRLRPRAEQLRALYGLLMDDVSTYTGELQAYFAPGDGSPSAWVDERADVLHNLSSADVVDFEAMELSFLALFSPQNLAMVARFCVQPVKVAINLS